jgi:curved DNA-binding protein CbpA
MDRIKALNNDPKSKLSYLRQLLQLPNITSAQQSKIYSIIQETEQLVITQNKFYSANNIHLTLNHTVHHIPNQQQRSNTVMPIKTNTVTNTIANILPLAPEITRDHNPRSREITKVQTFNDMNTLSAHYKDDESRAEAEFELEQRRRAETFKEAQRKRRMEYQSKLGELESNKVDSLRIFGLGPNYTLEELKHAYKRLAIETHPDRPGGSTERFQTVTKCYMSLLEKLKGSHEQTFDELKKGSRSYMKGQPSSNQTPDLYRTGGFKGAEQDTDIKRITGETIDLSSKNFNVKLFNKVYEANKLWDPNDDGYDDWFRKGDVDDIVKAPPVFSNKFNIDVFNSTFGDWKGQVDQHRKQQHSGTTGSLVEYKEPKELINTTASWSLVDAGQKIGDFTKAPDQGGNLGYTDLKLAYGGNCDMINPATAEMRESYKSIDDLKRARESISYNMSPQDMAREEARRYSELQAEEERLARLRNHERIQADHYTSMHERLLGYKKAAEY